MKIAYKPIKQPDFAFLKIVYRGTREGELNANNWTADQKNSFIEFQFNAQHAHYTSTFKGAEFNIITFNKINIGRLYTCESEKEIRLIDISLLPKYRGKGIGTRILKNLIEKSNTTGKVLNLHVLQTSPALKLYKLLNFKITENNNSHFYMEHLPEN